jgi:hypothetical protein
VDAFVRGGIVAPVILIDCGWMPALRLFGAPQIMAGMLPKTRLTCFILEAEQPSHQYCLDLLLEGT